MRTVGILTSFFLALVIFGGTRASAEVINSNLTVGSRGEEVVLLQQFLVSNGFLVIPAGVSYGYFGSLTKAAVAKWQDASGISPALGYFGPISRGIFTNQTLVAGPSLSVSPATSVSLEKTIPDTSSAPGLRVNKVMLFRVFPSQVGPGDKVTLYGSGFSKTTNDINFNGTPLTTASSSNGITLEVELPTSFTLGEYSLSVSNSLGSSDNANIKVVLNVVSNPENAPTIESASVNGDLITLTGESFTTSNNLYTSLGFILGRTSSDNRNLTFLVTDLSWYSKIKESLHGNKYKMTLWIFVQNENGMNKDPYGVEITI